jgi:Arc/MetJ-type ribon-helix-helix transcriptional regulator
MALTVRLDTKTERALNQLVRRRRQTRSDVVREAIEYYTAEQAGHHRDASAFDTWSDVVGLVDLGGRQREATTGERFTDLVRRKARARRAR